MPTPSEQVKSKTDSSHGGPADEESKLQVGELLTSVQDVEVDMKLEAKDAYGKW